MPEPKPQNSRTVLFVLGMHRSGTSLLSGLIAKAGIELGPSLMSSAPDNPEGFWENQRIVDLHERVLNHFGQSWSSWEPLPHDWQKLEDTLSLRQKLQDVLAEEFADEALFCVKDPRLCRLLPMWRDLCPDLELTPKCVLIGRPLEEVVASLQARDGLGRAHAEALWLRYCLDMLEHSKGLEVIHTSYDELLEDPGPTLDKVSHIIGRQLPVPDSSLVDSSLKHHSASTESQPWADLLFSRVSDAETRLSPGFDELVTPLVNQLAESEQRLNEALVTPEQLGSDQLKSARESRLFDQAEDARRHALSMEKELEPRNERLADSVRYAESLKTALANKESDFDKAINGHKEDIARREEYTQSLLYELSNIRAQLEEELQRFRVLRKLSEMFKGAANTDE